MRKPRRSGFLGLPTSFLDVLFNLILIFLTIAILALLLINPIVKKKDVEEKAEFIITIEWPKGDVDVDIWIMDPDERIMFYREKEVGVLNLERDDTGNIKDVIVVDGKAMTLDNKNYERVSIRGVYPGTYVVNIHLYRHGLYPQFYSRLDTPIPVDVAMQKINPSVKTYFSKKVYLRYMREEVHVFTFTVDRDGDIEEVRTDRPESIVSKLESRSFFNNGQGIPEYIQPEHQPIQETPRDN